MSSPGSPKPSRDETSSSKSGEGSNSAAAPQRQQRAQNNQGQRVNFPQVVHVGRHPDGDTDEINVIVCTQRARRRYAGELPRCYTFGWRHINNFEVPPAGKPSLMPPKFGQEREVPGYWKERVIGSIDHPTWEGDQDEDGDAVERPLNYIEKREEWKEGNHVSYGTGSASAFEKIQGMHVPLHSYESHRRIREDLWTTERVAANMAKHHAKALKHHMRAEEQRRKAEAAQSTVYSAGASTSTATQTSSVTHSSTSTQLASTDQSQASSSASTSTSTVPASTAVVKSKAVPAETKDAPQQKPTPPVDRRFAPENIPHLPWYRRLWDYGPPPTGWTADERYAHRSYLIPHPLHALKDNLVRSWMLVLSPTWKLTKSIAVSFSSGAQRRFWLEMWTYSRENKQMKMLSEASTVFKRKMAEEEEKQRLEALKTVEATQSAMAAADKVINQLENLDKEGKVSLTPQEKAELVELKKQRAVQEDLLKIHKEELDKRTKSRPSDGRNDRNSSSSS